MDNRLSEKKKSFKELLEKIKEHLDVQLENYQDSRMYDANRPISDAAIQARAVIELYDSSEKIKFYSKVLAILTVVLIVLTAVLTYRTFTHP